MSNLYGKTAILLILITILAGSLRFYKLGKIPSSLSWDEVAQGYNAFSLLTTGKDEFGRFLPVNYLESFGDFKPVLYTYTAIIPIKIWGLNEFSTRFPSAFFGTLTVFLAFFLVRELFSKYQEKNIIALLTALILGLSPWHIQISRAAFEANIGLFWTVFGIWLLLRGLHGDNKSLIGSALPFAATFYTFNSTRAFIPFIVIAVVLLNIRQWKKYLKPGLLFVLFFLILLIPVLPHLFSPQASLRFREVNIFSDLAPIEVSNTRTQVDGNTKFAKIIHNRRWMFSLEFLKHYFDNLNLRFLFLNGDGNPKFSLQDIGQMYLIDLPFFIFGLMVLFRIYPREAKYLILWLLLGIIPAATARETPHALRILQSLPVWQIIIAIGIFYFLKLNTKPLLKKVLLTSYLLLLTFNVFLYLHDLFIHYPVEFAGEWQYGYKQAIAYADSVYPQYDHILMTENLGRPYIYFLYYNQYSSDKFRRTADISRDAFGFVKVRSFDKYVFGETDTLKNIPQGKTLIIAPAGNVTTGTKVLKDIFLPNGNPVLKIYER